MAAIPFAMKFGKFLSVPLLGAFVVSGCVGFDPAISHCEKNGLKKGSSEFKHCVQEQRHLNSRLTRRHTGGGP